MPVGGLYDIEFEGSTEKDVFVAQVDTAFGFTAIWDIYKGLPQLQAKMYNEFMNNLPLQAFEKFESEGRITLISADVTKLEVWYSLSRPADVWNYPFNKVRFHYRATLRIATTEPLESSPLEPMTLAFIAKVITIIVNAIVTFIIAYFVIQAVKDWLISMTTTTTKVITYNPETGEYKEEWRREPDISGIIATAAGFGIVIVIVVSGYMLYRELRAPSPR